MWTDLRFAFRTYTGQPAFTVVVILTLVLGIGGSTAIFSVLNAVLLRDLPYPKPGQIYVMNSVTPDGAPTGNVTPRETRPFESAQHPLVQATAIAWSQEVQLVGADGRAHPTVRYGVTDQFFEVFGTRMARGRAFRRGQPAGPIVIAYATWRDIFASDPRIVGRVVQAEGREYEVVGVARADFEFPQKPGFFYLMNLGTAYDRVRAYRGYVRLRDGGTGAQFQSELNRVSREIGPDLVSNQPTLLVATPFLQHVVGPLGPRVVVLFGATAILLLIACINVTNLLLSRATVRAREMAVREALGARRWPLVRQLLTESLLLSSVAGALGLAAAVGGVKLMLRLAPPGLPRLDAVPIDAPVLTFAVGVTLLTGVLVGLAPAWRLATNDLRSLVNEAGRGAPGGPIRHRLFGSLIVIEIALAVLLVVAAGLLGRSYANLVATDPGFNPAKIVTFFLYVPGRVEMRATRGADGKFAIRGSYAPMATFFRELEDRIRHLPGVEAVAATTTLPLDRAQYDTATVFDLPGQSNDPNQAVRSARTRSISPDFFRVLGIRLLAGRGLSTTDRAGAGGVAVVNRTFARRFFPGQSALGRRIRYRNNEWVPGGVGFQLSHLTVDELEIVGIVDDVKYVALGEPPEPSIYVSSEQWTHRRQTLVVRTSLDDPSSLIPTLRREVAAMDPSLTTDVSMYPSIVREAVAGERMATTLLGLFAFIALTLAAVGVYGLMAYSVARRTGEIAVRMALGASRSNVLRLIMGWGARLAAAGVAFGLLAALALRQTLASQLYGVTPADTSVLGLASLALLLSAALACFVPAHRATRVQLAELLRSE